MSLALYNFSDTPAMPLKDAHFGGFFVGHPLFDGVLRGVAIGICIGIMRGNNTRHASPRCAPGGLLFCGVGKS